MDNYQYIKEILNSDVATICSTILLVSFIAAIVVCIIVVLKNIHERKCRKLEIEKEKWDKLTSIRKELQFNTLEVIKEQIKNGSETVDKYVGKADEYIGKYESHTIVLNENNK